MENPTAPEERKRRWRTPIETYFVAVILAIYWAALFYGTHVKLPPAILPGNSDKVIHFLAYTGLGVLLMSLRATRGVYPWFSVIMRWLVLASYGAFDEMTQLLVQRDAEVFDWLADISGSALGLGLVTFVLWYFRKSVGSSSSGDSPKEIIPN